MPAKSPESAPVLDISPQIDPSNAIEYLTFLLRRTYDMGDDFAAGRIESQLTDHILAEKFEQSA